MIMIYQHRCIYSSKYSTPAHDADSEGGCECVGTGVTWEISVPSVQFCCELKTTFKEQI
jgi:hypothetical protein